MQLLYDAVLPQSLSYEMPASSGVVLVRWEGAEASDTELVQETVERGCRGLILLGRDSLEQSDLREAAKKVGIALVASATDNPTDAKRHILKNIRAIRYYVNYHDCLLVLAAGVRPAPACDG